MQYENDGVAHIFTSFSYVLLFSYTRHHSGLMSRRNIYSCDVCRRRCHRFFLQQQRMSCNVCLSDVYFNVAYECVCVVLHCVVVFHTIFWQIQIVCRLTFKSCFRLQIHWTEKERKLKSKSTREKDKREIGEEVNRTNEKESNNRFVRFALATPNQQDPRMSIAVWRCVFLFRDKRHRKEDENIRQSVHERDRVQQNKERRRRMKEHIVGGHMFDVHLIRKTMAKRSTSASIV